MPFAAALSHPVIQRDILCHFGTPIEICPKWERKNLQILQRGRAQLAGDWEIRKKKERRDNGRTAAREGRRARKAGSRMRLNCPRPVALGSLKPEGKTSYVPLLA